MGYPGRGEEHAPLPLRPNGPWKKSHKNMATDRGGLHLMCFPPPHLSEISGPATGHDGMCYAVCGVHPDLGVL